MIVDDRPAETPRHEARDELDAKLARPLNPAKASAHDEEEWVKMNTREMARQGIITPDGQVLGPDGLPMPMPTAEQLEEELAQ